MRLRGPDGAPGWSAEDAVAVRRWFADYLAWMTSHEYGIAERDTKNNHATCWVMQEAAFAHLTGNAQLLADARRRFRTVLVPDQMAPDGSFPLELARTKPYGYSLFNLEALATIAQIASTADDNLWMFELADGRGLRRAMAFMTPFIRDRRALAEAPGRDVRRPVADASEQPDLRGRGARPSRVSRRVDAPAGGLPGGRGHPQLLHPSASAVVRLNGVRASGGICGGGDARGPARTN